MWCCVGVGGDGDDGQFQIGRTNDDESGTKDQGEERGGRGGTVSLERDRRAIFWHHQTGPTRSVESGSSGMETRVEQGAENRMEEAGNGRSTEERGRDLGKGPGVVHLR